MLHIFNNDKLVSKARRLCLKIFLSIFKSNMVAKCLAIDGELSDGEDNNENNLPDLTVEVDDDSYPCLPKGFVFLKLKQWQQLVLTVFQKAYGELICIM
jgi:hypothetical protein